MTLLDRTLKFFGLARRQARRQIVRTYQAALPSRQTADWPMVQTSANADIRRALRNLRARSRELQRNNALIKKFISMIGNNVAGPEGMTLSDVLQPEDGQELDAEFNDAVIKAFNEWARPENASSSGKLSWADQQKLIMETVARDGEVLIRKRIGDNPFAFCLQFVDVSWLDETFNTILENGNRVLMSVELNPLDRPVAYWLTRPASDYLYPEYGEPIFRQRVPAEEIYHWFITTEHETQVRGVPWAHAVMEMLHTINGYVDAELYAARAGACVTDYLIPPKETEVKAPDETNALPPDPRISQSFQPGAVRELETAVMQITPPGYEVKSNDPKHPNTNFESFLKGSERFVATGLDVPYFRLASDLNGVNYTSSRAGDNEARDLYRWLQRWLRDKARMVFFDVARRSMLTGAMPISILDFDRLDPTFHPRGWDSVDEQKDATADDMRISACTDTLTRVCADRGLDFRKIVKKRAEEIALLKKYGVEAFALKPRVPSSPIQEEPASDQPPDAPPPGEPPPKSNGDAHVL